MARRYTVRKEPPPARKPRLSRAGACVILQDMVNTLSQQIDGVEYEKDDNGPWKKLRAVRGYLIAAARRVERGDDPQKVLAYDPIKQVSDRDVGALVRTGLTTGFFRPKYWGWQVVNDQLEWVSREEWDEVFELW